MIKWVSHIIMIIMIPVLLMTTTGFTLSHHFCNHCGVGESSISLFSNHEEHHCEHKHASNENQHDCEGTCSTEHNHPIEKPCCQNEMEFYKLSSPFVNFIKQIDNIQPSEIELPFTCLSNNIIHITELTAVQYIFIDDPPDTDFKYQAQPTLCTFLL